MNKAMNERPRKKKPYIGIFLFNLPEMTSPLVELSYVIINQENKNIQRVFKFINQIVFGNQKNFLFESLNTIHNYILEKKFQVIPVFYNTISVSNFLFRMKDPEFLEMKKFCKNSVELFDIILPNQHYSEASKLKFVGLPILKNEIIKLQQLNQESQHYVALILYLNQNQIYFYNKHRKNGNIQCRQSYINSIENIKQRIQSLIQQQLDKNVQPKKNNSIQSLSSIDYEIGDESDDQDEELKKAIQLNLIENQQNTQILQQLIKQQYTDEHQQMHNSNQNMNFLNPQKVNNQFLYFNNDHFTDQMAQFTSQQRRQEILFKQGQDERRKKFEEIQKKQQELFFKSEKAMYDQFISRQRQELESFQKEIKQLSTDLNNQLNF